MFCYSLYLTSIQSNCTALGVTIKTSNRLYETWYAFDDLAEEEAYWSFTGSHVCDLDATDTCYISVYYAGGGADMDIHADSKFSGALIC